MRASVVRLRLRKWSNESRLQASARTGALGPLEASGSPNVQQQMGQLRAQALQVSDRQSCNPALSAHGTQTQQCTPEPRTPSKPQSSGAPTGKKKWARPTKTLMTRSLLASVRSGRGQLYGKRMAVHLQNAETAMLTGELQPHELVWALPVSNRRTTKSTLNFYNMVLKGVFKYRFNKDAAKLEVAKAVAVAEDIVAKFNMGKKKLDAERIKKVATKWRKVLGAVKAGNTVRVEDLLGLVTKAESTNAAFLHEVVTQLVSSKNASDEAELVEMYTQRYKDGMSYRKIEKEAGGGFCFPAIKESIMAVAHEKAKAQATTMTKHVLDKHPNPIDALSNLRSIFPLPENSDLAERHFRVTALAVVKENLTEAARDLGVERPRFEEEKPRAQSLSSLIGSQAASHVAATQAAADN